MADVNIDGVVTWLKNWFYDKTEIGTLLNAKANLNQNQANYNVVTDASGNITVEAKPTIPTDVSELADSTGVIPTDVSDLTDTQNTAFTPKSHTHGNLSNGGKIGSTANLPLITTNYGVVTTGSFGTSANTFCQGNDSRLSDARTPTAHNQASSTITDSNTYSNIGNSAQTQDSINSAIDTKLGQLSSIDALVMVDTLPTASSSTMGKLYVINENSKINFYWTKRSGTSSSYTYAWEKMDTDILDELVVNWSDVQNKPTTYTPSSHTHGYIKNDGKIDSGGTILDSDENFLVVTNSSKLIGIGSASAQYILDYNGGDYTNIGSSDADEQITINYLIDTALGTKGAKTDDVDWSYSSNGFTNGVKLVSKTDNANGRITLHLKS